jgi:hypothetical protein
MPDGLLGFDVGSVMTAFSQDLAALSQKAYWRPLRY